MFVTNQQKILVSFQWYLYQSLATIWFLQKIVSHSVIQKVHSFTGFGMQGSLLFDIVSLWEDFSEVF